MIESKQTATVKTVIKKIRNKKSNASGSHVHPLLYVYINTIQLQKINSEKTLYAYNQSK